MHSSTLRASDFVVETTSGPTTHHDHFSSFTVRDRVGVVVSKPLGGLRAATLLMAYVTAFYDRHRETTENFFTYPDFFTFQGLNPLDDYGMFDIWPEEKNVSLPEDPWDKLSTVASRGINVLLVPEQMGTDLEAGEDGRSRAALASLRRNITACYAYGVEREEADLTITCNNESLMSWGEQVAQSNGREDLMRSCWESAWSAGALVQSYRSVALEDALRSIISPAVG